MSSSKTVRQYERRHRGSPPRTPPPNGRYRSSARNEHNGQLGSRPSYPETFLDDFTPVDNRHPSSSEDDERDLHDLSLSSKYAVRTSIVDNMLLSLDQFDLNASGDPSSYQGTEDSDPYTLHSRYSAKKDGRHRGHTFSASQSSDVDTCIPDRPGRRPPQPTHGRRSDSSSNYPPNISRAEGQLRGESQLDNARSTISDNTHAPTNRADRAVPKRGTRPAAHERRNSDSSGDGASRYLAGSRAARTKQHRRSASFDYGTRTKPAVSAGYEKTHASRDSSRDHSLHYHDIDAAPTPTVPAGPRKDPTVPLNDSYSSSQGFVSNNPPAPSRKSSSKSAKSMHNRKARSNTLGTSTIKSQGDNHEPFLAAAAALDEDIPPVPPYAQQTAPSPTISRNKSSYFNNNSAENSPTPPAPKERPGFFRRVFGSSKNTTPTPSQSPRDSPRNKENEVPNQNKASNNNTPSSSKTLKPSPMDQTAGANKVNRDNPPAVTKKPSSFFRRRKKSTVDHAPPPLMLQNSNHQARDQPKSENARVEQMKLNNAAAPEPSPVSSLRKIMKPYLADGFSPETPRATHHQQDADSSVDDADVETSSAEIRLDDPGMPGPSERTPRFNEHFSQEDFPHPSSTHASNSKSTFDTGPASHERSDSFLADSSGNEASSKQVSGSKSKRPQTSAVGPNHAGRTSLERQRAARDIVSSSNNTSKSTLQVPAGPSASHSLLPSKGGQASEPPPALSALPPRSYRQSYKAATPAQHEKDWLEPNSSTEQLDDSPNLALPIEGTAQSPQLSVSTASHYHTASNTPVIPSEDGPAQDDKQPGPQPDTTGKEEAEQKTDKNSLDDVSPADRNEAQKLYDAGGEEAAENEHTAAWLGSPDRGGIRKAYMAQFDWSDMNILMALQSLCSRVALKGEAQQVDRVLDAFSSRWCECNPKHGFKAADVVHTICYSLLLLNTDLHLADIEQKMTRPQFIRNTMPTIHRVVTDAAPDAFDSAPEPSKPQGLGLASAARRSQIFGHGRRPSVADSDADGTQTNNLSASQIGLASDIGPLVTMPFRGTMKAWEAQVESVLKEFYNSIQKQRLPLRGAIQAAEEPSQNNNLLSITPNFLRRTPSSLSRPATESHPRGRAGDQRPNTARWSSRPRARPRLYPASTMASSRTSLDDQSSIFSPSASSTWSKNSLGKTLTSMSVDSFGTEYPRGDYKQSIGFANALSHAIIREDSASVSSGMEDPARSQALLEDESLELAGAPWAKEGTLKHKHHLDAVDKRSKDRNWNENFAVIQRGWMRLFSFNASSKSMRLKAKQKQKDEKGALVVGGGNWTENAEETWKFLLRQTIASALPPPGYSKSRPHVWALSLPTGAVHLFQAGTPEIVKEFVSTVNYWSARLSKEPLFGGVSNIEYGWSDGVVNSALINPDENKKNSTSGARPSIQSSIRGSIDQQGIRPRLPADRINISDWSPPQQSMLASTLSETEQLNALRNYVKNVEEELQRHNELRGPMVLAFTPKHPNAAKAMANWERKSSYLLREIVKFRTYIDCLTNAQGQKEKVLGPSEGTAAGQPGKGAPTTGQQTKESSVDVS